MIRIIDKTIYWSEWSNDLSHSCNWWITEQINLAKKDGYSLDKYELIPPTVSFSNSIAGDNTNCIQEYQGDRYIDGKLVLFFKQTPLSEVINASV